MTVRELAEAHGKSEAAIRKWLHALEQETPGVIKRAGAGCGRGARIWVTLSSLRRADKDFIEHQAIARDEIAELRAKCSTQREELISLRSRIRRLEQLVELLAKESS